MRTFDVPQIAELQRRFRSVGHIVQHRVQQRPVGVARAAFQGGEQPDAGRSSAVDRPGHDAHHLRSRALARQVENGVVDAEPRWRSDDPGRSTGGPVSDEPPRTGHPHPPVGGHQHVDYPGRRPAQDFVEVARSLRPEPGTITTQQDTAQGERGEVRGHRNGQIQPGGQPLPLARADQPGHRVAGLTHAHHLLGGDDAGLQASESG